jgi:hypothetical protein
MNQQQKPAPETKAEIIKRLIAKAKLDFKCCGAKCGTTK